MNLKISVKCLTIQLGLHVLALKQIVALQQLVTPSGVVRCWSVLWMPMSWCSKHQGISSQNTDSLPDPVQFLRVKWWQPQAISRHSTDSALDLVVFLGVNRWYISGTLSPIKGHWESYSRGSPAYVVSSRGRENEGQLCGLLSVLSCLASGTCSGSNLHSAMELSLLSGDYYNALD